MFEGDVSSPRSHVVGSGRGRLIVRACAAVRAHAVVARDAFGYPGQGEAARVPPAPLLERYTLVTSPP